MVATDEQVEVQVLQKVMSLYWHLSWDPVWVPGLNFLPLIGFNPGL